VVGRLARSGRVGCAEDLRAGVVTAAARGWPGLRARAGPGGSVGSL